MIESILSLITAGNVSAVSTMADQEMTDGFSSAEKLQMAFAAARAGQAEMLRFLFENHLYSADPDPSGRNLLHEAALSGDEQTVLFAMDVLGFDPLGGDLNGITPLELSAFSENKDAFLLLTERLGFSPGQCYRNPILRGFHPDPSIVRAGEDYYLVTSSFVLFPGLPVFHSRDLVHWQEISHAVSDLDSSGLAGLPGGFGYWAPDISFYRGKFWIVATLRRNTPPYRLQMITSARDPRGPWAPPSFLPLDGIDPSLFMDDDGRRYILLNPGAIIAEISEEGTLLSAPRLISFGSARIKPEGPHLLRHKDYYYLFMAEGGTGENHMETVLRSKNLYGPYESCPYNPILSRRNPLSPIQRSGHGKPVQLPDGQWYMTYLCTRPVDGMTLMGRETALDPMSWTSDDWPVINHLKGPGCLHPLPLPSSPVCQNSHESWISPRNDPARFAVFNENSIILHCGPDPSATEPCSLLLCRQSEASFSQSVHVSVQEADEGSAGGLIGYYDEHSFCFLALRRETERFAVILTEQIGDVRKTDVLAVLQDPFIDLLVEGRGLDRTFSLLRDGISQHLASLRTPYLCDEGLPSVKRFTGALSGLAAVGNGKVHFSHFTVSHSDIIHP